MHSMLYWQVYGVKFLNLMELISEVESEGEFVAMSGYGIRGVACRGGDLQPVR